MSRKNKILLGVLLGFLILFVSGVFLSDKNIPVLQPAGEIGEKQRNLLYFSVLLSVIVVVPVFVMLFVFSFKYREGNHKAKYDPKFVSSKKLESIWWGIPFAIIFILSVVTWNSSHDLDPFKRISAANKPMKIQVIALQWKWLFIYPEQNIATVNYVQIPVDTPIDFEVTSDAPMNSFWIPQLGSQIYAMSGMSTHVNLIANKVGNYAGKSANISGEGFSKMTFTAHASKEGDFKNWVSNTQYSGSKLDMDAYNSLAQPSTIDQPITYSSASDKIFNTVINKYMHGENQENHDHDSMQSDEMEHSHGAGM